MLDLSSNKLKNIVPLGTSNAALNALKLPSLISLNISDNPFKEIRPVIDVIS